MIESHYKKATQSIEGSSGFNYITDAIKRQSKRYQVSYSNPASIKLALKHQKATKFGYKPPSKQTNRKKARALQRQQRCQCCNFSSNVQDIQIFHSMQPQVGKQYKLPEDVGLYFTFIKTVIIFVILHTVTHAAFNILSSGIGGKYCNQLQSCQKQIWNKTAISNKYDRHDLITIVDILCMVCIIASIAYLGWSRRYFYQISQKIDAFSVSQDQFTLFLTNLPKVQYPQTQQNVYEIESTFRQKLKQYFHDYIAEGIKNGELKRSDISFDYLLHPQQQIKKCNEIITSISLCYNLDDYEVLHNQKWANIWEFQNNFILFDFLGFQLPDLFGFKNPINLQASIVGEDNSSPTIKFMKTIETNLNEQIMFAQLDLMKKNELNEIRKKVSFLNESQIHVSYELVRNNKLYFHNTTFSGNAFLSFEFEDFKDYIYEKYLADPKQFEFEGVQIKIEEACDPTDVNWRNMKVSPTTRFNRIIFSYIVLVMLLSFSFMILFSVEVMKINYVQNSDGSLLTFAKTQTLSLITSLLILGANSLFDFVSSFLTEMQGHVTNTNHMFSQVVKSFFSRLINTVVLYFVIAVILTKDYDESKFLTSTGLVTQIFNFIVVSGLTNLISEFINTNDIWLRVKRWFIYTLRQQDDEVFTKFQITLNRQFQHPEFNLVYKYNNYLVTLYTALFYAYLVPMGIPTLIVIFTVQYWIDKISLFKRCSLKNHFSYNLSIYMRRIFQSSVMMFAVGNLIFSYYLEDYHICVFNVISFVIALIFTVCVWVAPEKVERKLFGKYQICDNISYSDCQAQQQFRTTYWNQNPATFCVDERFQMAKTTLYRKSDNHRKSVHEQEKEQQKEQENEFKRPKVRFMN